MKKINSIQDFFKAKDEINETREAMSDFIIEEIKKKFIGTIFKYDDYLFDVYSLVSISPSHSHKGGGYDGEIEAYLIGTGYTFKNDGNVMSVDINRYDSKFISFKVSTDGIHPCSYPEIMAPEKCSRMLILHGATEEALHDFEERHI